SGPSRPARASASGVSALAIGAHAEELQPVPLDAEPGAIGQLVGEGSDVAALELDDRAAGGTDEVMPVSWLAEDVPVATIGAMDATEQAQADQQVERAEHRGPPGARTRGAQFVVDLVRGEGHLAGADRLHHLAPRAGDAQANVA